MESDVLLVSDDFMIVREKDALMYGLEAGRNLSRMTSDTIKVEWVIVSIVVSGEAECTINGKNYNVKAHDIIMSLPNYVLERQKKTDDLSVNSLCISRSLFQKAISFSLYNWDVVSFLIAHPILSLTDMYYSLISVKIGDKNKLGYRESMQCLLKSFMCELYGVIGRYISVGAVNYSQGHNLFKGFLDLLTSVYPKPRSVSFYAETLNVTSKYLSSVCKATCGETASMLIHKAVTKDIADLLSYSNKSIKEIMVELDFPSLSFFGKYVKKHFGVGPKEYRSKRLS